MDGNGPTQIARILKEEQVLTPTVYQDKQKRKVRCALPDNPYGWNDSTVSGILERMEYCGHTVNFKTHRQSYKIKKTIENPPDQWKIFRNTHEAIVDEETFDRVQELRRNKRRPAKTGKIDVCTVVARSLRLRRRSSTPRCRRPLYGHDAGYAVSGIGAAPSIWKFCRVPKRGKICADRIIYIVANCAV